MKHIYLIFFFFISAICLGQESAGSSDIEGFTLYPNPSINGKVYIKTLHNAPKKILIFDVLGTKVLETTILGKELNISNLDAGIYVLRVLEKDKVSTRKLIKK